MCTAFIVSEKLTEAGKPLLFKHRDIGSLTRYHCGNRVENHSCKKFGKNSILTIIDCDTKLNSERALCGINKVGFAVINTATYNLSVRNFNTQVAPSIVMYQALTLCESIEDFDNLLDHVRGEMMPANFGVIDKSGRACLYEVDRNTWKKEEVTEYPMGYITFTNFSGSGDPMIKTGFERYETANAIMNELVSERKVVSVESMFDRLSRSLRSDLLGIDLRHTPNPFGDYFIDGSFIPLRSTTFSVIFHKGVMWTILGYPLTGIIFPLMVGRELPEWVSGVKQTDRPLIDRLARRLQEKVFDINVGEGSKYFNTAKLFNTQGSGFTQQIQVLEAWMFQEFRPDFSDRELSDFYLEYTRRIEKLYSNMLSWKRPDDRYLHYKLCAMDEKRDYVILRKKGPFSFFSDCLRRK